MTTKDWKKKKSKFSNIVYWEKNDGGIVEVAWDVDALGNADNFRIYINNNDDEVAKWLNTRRFSTKNKAIKEAKEYMRTH